MAETRAMSEAERIKRDSDYILNKLYEMGTPSQVVMPVILISERLNVLSQFDSPQNLRAVISQVILRVHEDAKRYEKEFLTGPKLPNSSSMGGMIGG